MFLRNMSRLFIVLLCILLEFIITENKKIPVEERFFMVEIVQKLSANYA